MIIRRKVPDGGWGWVIVFGAFAIHVITDGVVYTTAVFYKPWIEHYKASVFVTTMVLSLTAGACLFIGPVAAAFIAVYGCRKVALFGGVISTIGLTISAYAPNIYVLLFSFGLMTGCGYGFLYITSVVVITEYFDKRLAFAAGLACCGSSVGIIVYAPLTENLTAHFKWQTTIVILSAINLLTVLFSMTFIPIETSIRSMEDLNAGLVKLGSDPNENSDNATDTETKTKTNTETGRRTSLSLEDADGGDKEDEPSKAELFKDSMRTMFGTKLMLNPRFVIVIMASFLVCLGFLAPQIFIKVRALSLEGVKSEEDTHGLLTVIGVGSTIGRVLFGYIADYKWCHRFVVFVSTTVICGIATTLSVFCNTYISLAIYCFTFGLTSGAFIAISSVVITDLFGVEMVANAFGLLTLFEGIGSFIGPPFIGLFESKEHKREFVIAGVLMIAGGLSYTLVPAYDSFHGQCSTISLDSKSSSPASNSKRRNNQNATHEELDM